MAFWYLQGVCLHQQQLWNLTNSSFSKGTSTCVHYIIRNQVFPEPGQVDENCCRSFFYIFIYIFTVQKRIVLVKALASQIHGYYFSHNKGLVKQFYKGTVSSWGIWFTLSVVFCYFRFLLPLRSFLWCHGSVQSRSYCHWWTLYGIELNWILLHTFLSRYF